MISSDAPPDDVIRPWALSPSRASDFTRCPLLYRLRAIDRLPEPPSPAALRGTLVHAVLERMFDQPAPARTPTRIAALVGPVWAELREEVESAQSAQSVPTVPTLLEVAARPTEPADPMSGSAGIGSAQWLASAAALVWATSPWKIRAGSPRRTANSAWNSSNPMASGCGASSTGSTSPGRAGCAWSTTRAAPPRAWVGRVGR